MEGRAGVAQGGRREGSPEGKGGRRANEESNQAARHCRVPREHVVAEGQQAEAASARASAKEAWADAGRHRAGEAG